jgi:hypothetical protein
MPPVKSFFPPLVVAGQPIDLTHLEPFQFVMPTTARPKGAVVDVRFSNHCYSDAYDPERHPDPVDVWDRGKRRVFDQGRYDLSLGLRAAIEVLPASNVYHTPEANFVRIVAPGNETLEYRIYFNVRQGGGGPVGADVSLFVESAYRPDQRKQVLKPAQMTKVKFALLVDKTVRGEKLRFQYRR